MYLLGRVHRNSSLIECFLCSIASLLSCVRAIRSFLSNEICKVGRAALLDKTAVF